MNYGYWLIVLIPLLMPASFALRGLPGMSGLFSWVPVMVLFGLLPVLDWIIGRDESNPLPGPSRVYPDILIS